MWSAISALLPFLLGVIGKIIANKVKKGELTENAHKDFLSYTAGLEDSLADSARLRDQAKSQRDELNKPPK